MGDWEELGVGGRLLTRISGFAIAGFPTAGFDSHGGLSKDFLGWPDDVG
jgi:hypothetical protein